MAKAKKQSTNNNRQQNQAGALKVHGFRPLTTNQDISHQNIKNGFDTFILGSAGTGKTFLAINAAMELVDEGEVRRVIIVRSTVHLETKDSCQELPMRKQRYTNALLIRYFLTFMVGAMPMVFSNPRES